MFSNVIDTWTQHSHGDIMPRHTTMLCLGQLVLLPILDVFEVHDTIVVEVLTGPDLVGDAFRVHIRQAVLMVVPTAEAEIEATNEGHLVVNDNELFVMGPVKSHVGNVLQDIVVGMAHDRDVSVPRGAFWAECLEGMLGMGRITSNCGFDFAVYNDIDLDAGFSTTFENLVKSPFLVIGGRTTQEEFGGKPPVGNVDGLFCLFESYRDSLARL